LDDAIRDAQEQQHIQDSLQRSNKLKAEAAAAEEKRKEAEAVAERLGKEEEEARRVQEEEEGARREQVMKRIVNLWGNRVVSDAFEGWYCVASEVSDVCCSSMLPLLIKGSSDVQVCLTYD
jgi:hypothetical protein